MELAIGIVGSALIGYTLGCLSPSALISKLKKKDIRKSGTRNLGATNVLLNFGKLWFVLVMLFDIFKAFAAYKLAKHLLPMLSIAGPLAGSFSVVGHVFPFYLKFKGGKGLAAFLGFLLAYDPILFLILVVAGAVMVLIVNQTFMLPYFTGIAFPICAVFETKDVLVFSIVLLASVLLLWKHAENLKKATTKSDVKVREYIKTSLLKHGEKKE